MIKFTAILEKFGKKGEKTGWTYILIPQEVTEKIKPNTRKSFRVKGKLDQFPVQQVSLLPMGDGDFILPLNAAMRKGIGKTKGMKLTVSLEEDKGEITLDTDLIACIKEDNMANKVFMGMPPSHQKYYSKWIESAKTPETKARRIAAAITALNEKISFGEMLKSAAKKKE